MRSKIILLALVFVFALLSTSFAAITIENRTGAVKIYMPDGKQIVVQSNEPLPTIPDGATVTILAGSATVGTTGNSTATVSIGTYTVQIQENSKVNFTLNPDGTATTTIILGGATVNRKGEAYENPNRPGAPEFEDNEIHEEISPHK